MSLVSVVLAGGSGTRLSPISSENLPKQFFIEQSIGKSFFQIAIENALSITNEVIVVTSTNLLILVQEQLKECLDKIYLVIEPEGRNTLPASLLGIMIAKQIGHEGVILLPSDHYFEDFRQIRKFILSDFSMIEAESCKIAKDHLKMGNDIMLVGCDGYYPNSLYGHILPETEEPYSKVTKFVEKPSIDESHNLLLKGALINCGILCGRTNDFLFLIQNLNAELFQNIINILNISEKKDKTYYIHQDYLDIQSMQIDKFILEKTENLVVFKYNAKFIDIGSFKSLQQLASFLESQSLYFQHGKLSFNEQEPEKYTFEVYEES